MSIQQNLNMVDRFARILIGGACMLAGSYLALPNLAIVALMIAGLYLMLSGLAGHCVLYKLLKMSTLK